MFQNSTEPLDAALSYAARGWAVFPLHGWDGNRCTCGRADCGAAAKHPRTARGLHDSSKAPDAIRAWWRSWPGANVGIATGRLSGIFVVDIDPRHLGDESLDDLERANGKLPLTIRTQTGGGGQHILFRLPGGRAIGSRTGIVAGVDIKGDGGYIVAPPSMHASGLRYVWDTDHHPDDVGIGDAPAWLLRLLEVRSEPQRKASSEWEAILAAGKRDGARNESLAKIVGHLLRRGVDIRVAADLLLGWNRAFVRPSLDDADVLKTISSIAKKHFAGHGTGRAGHAG